MGPQKAVQECEQALTSDHEPDVSEAQAHHICLPPHKQTGDSGGLWAISHMNSNGVELLDGSYSLHAKLRSLDPAFQLQ